MQYTYSVPWGEKHLKHRVSAKGHSVCSGFWKRGQHLCLSWLREFKISFLKKNVQAQIKGQELGKEQ